MAIRPRSVGELLDGAVRLYKQDLGLYMFTAIVASLPMALVTILLLTAGDSIALAIVSIVVGLVAIVASVAVWTALMIQMNERLEGREPRLGPSIKRSLALVLPVIWGGFLAYVVIFGVFALSVVAGIIGSVALALVAPETLAVIIGLLLGIATFVFVGLRAIAGMCLFLPGIVVEHLSGYGSIKRGYGLAEGGQFRIIGVLFVAYFLIMIPVMAVGIIAGGSTMLFDPTTVETGTIDITAFVLQQALSIVASGVATPFLVAAVLLLYFDQRIRREAYDLQAEADALAA